MTLSDMAYRCDKGRETEDLISTENGTTMPVVRPLTAGALLIGLSVPAAAAFRDSATGFSIAPPAPFVTVPTTHRTFDVAVGLRFATNLPPSVGRSPGAIGLGLRLWLAGVLIGALGHAAAVWAARRDPLSVEVTRRHLRIPAHLGL